MAECGAWVNFEALEDSLSLDELVQLHETSIERQERLIKTIAMALGAEFDDDDDNIEPSGSYDPEKGGNIGSVVAAQDAEALPINLGYSKI